MTNERAAEILNPEHREQYDSIEAVNEACRIGMNAIIRLAKIEKQLADGYMLVEADNGGLATMTFDRMVELIEDYGCVDRETAENIAQAIFHDSTDGEDD